MVILIHPRLEFLREQSLAHAIIPLCDIAGLFGLCVTKEPTASCAKIHTSPDMTQSSPKFHRTFLQEVKIYDPLLSSIGMLPHSSDAQNLCLH